VRFRTTRSTSADLAVAGAKGQPEHTCSLRDSGGPPKRLHPNAFSSYNCPAPEQQRQRWSFTEDVTSTATSTSQLDYFLLEYRGLQDELKRMREACDNLRHANLKGDMEALKASLDTKRPPRPILKRQRRLSDSGESSNGNEAAANLHPLDLGYYYGKHGSYSLERRPPRRLPPVVRHGHGGQQHNKPRRLLPQPQPRRHP
jgi:hypothetical protein